MPTYEYRCRTCDDVFELDRPMSRSSDPASCPEGHPDAIKLLSRFMSLRDSAGGGEPAPAMAPSGFGGCGSGCGCH